MSEGKLDKTKAEIKICKFKDIRHIFEEFHYKKGAMGGGISVCFAMFYEGILVGGSVMGKPRHEKKYKNCIDIRRMACIDSSPCNSESWFLSQMIRWCASNTDYNYVLSYSDKTVGHSGTIYKAANFENIGETAPTKFVEWGEKTYHPRSLSIDRPYSYKLREAVKNDVDYDWNELVQEYVQSLSAQKLPKEFIPEYETKVFYPKEMEIKGQGWKVSYPVTEKVLKTTINSECKYELVGTYKY